jgi:hypothetical protein
MSEQFTPARRWCVQFWDSDAWNELSDTRRRLKAECVELAQRLNRQTGHEERVGSFGGRRFRVRRVEEE